MTADPGLDTVLRRRSSPDVEEVQVDGETVVYDGARDVLHVLDPPATLVWNGLDGSMSLGELCSDLASRLGIPEPDDMVADVLTFAAQLHDLRLVEQVP